MTGQPAPAIIVRIELEGTPRVFCDYMDDGAERRMLDWLEQHPEFVELIHRALESEAAA